MEILKLKPAIKDYIWGGRKLIDVWGKDALGKECVAECWELSLHKDGLTVVDSGEHRGKTLQSVLSQWGKDALGTKAAEFEMFPQLIKLIDARDSLSIQVHPSDEYALKNEGQYGKTEVWYIADAEPSAGIYWGFKDVISKQEFEERIKNNTLCDALQFVEAQVGDVFFIEAGTIHAICKGLTIVEIQQNSNITYRVFDYGRVGADGKPRDLHIEKALDVTLTEPPKFARQSYNGEKVRKVASCKYFDVTEYSATERLCLTADSHSFNAIVVLSGGGEITYQSTTLTYKKGDTFFIPANLGTYNVDPASETRFLLSRVETN